MSDINSRSSGDSKIISHCSDLSILGAAYTSSTNEINQHIRVLRRYASTDPTVLATIQDGQEHYIAQQGYLGEWSTMTSQAHDMRDKTNDLVSEIKSAAPGTVDQGELEKIRLNFEELKARQAEHIEAFKEAVAVDPLDEWGKEVVFNEEEQWEVDIQSE